jgi:hypothetical protein
VFCGDIIISTIEQSAESGKTLPPSLSADSTYSPFCLVSPIDPHPITDGAQNMLRISEAQTTRLQIQILIRVEIFKKERKFY